ncbi:MAG: ribbon-helix-helix protein, CopG family [Chloroflexi bacterium]|nr:ribbon-helix-helix protein, CopG family [Chloroflexota bacterium]
MAADRKEKNIMVRVSRETHSTLKKKAAAEGTTMSQIVRYAIELYLKGQLYIPK